MDKKTRSSEYDRNLEIFLEALGAPIGMRCTDLGS